MKKIFIVFFAVTMIIGTVDATENNSRVITSTNKMANSKADAIIAKLKALTENYKSKVNAARNVNELMSIASEYGNKSESLAYECMKAYENGLMTGEEFKKCEGAFYKYANEMSKASRNKRAQLTR